MKKFLALLAGIAVTVGTTQVFAQASTTNAVQERQPNTAQHPHKQLKTHGKRAAVSDAASAAGTSDKGTQH